MSGGHSLEVAAGHQLRPVGDSRGPKRCGSVLHGALQVIVHPPEARGGGEDAGEQLRASAAHVHQAAEAPEVVRCQQHGEQIPRQLLHRAVEGVRLLGVVLEPSPEVGALDALEGVLARAHRLLQLGPGTVVRRGHHLNHRVAHGGRLVAAQRLGHRGEPEGAGRGLGENPVPGQRAQHAGQAVLVGAGLPGQLPHGPRPSGQQVRDAQLRHHRERLRPSAGGGDVQQRHRRGRHPPLDLGQATLDGGDGTDHRGRRAFSALRHAVASRKGLHPRAPNRLTRTI
jgi:hypothetical protein